MAMNYDDRKRLDRFCLDMRYAKDGWKKNGSQGALIVNAGGNLIRVAPQLRFMKTHFIPPDWSHVL